MMKDVDSAKTVSSGMNSLETLVGTWAISGGVAGEIRFERMTGGYFLIQHVDIASGGRRITGMEVIGRLHFPGGQSSAEIHSRFYSFLDGLTLDYVYEVEGDRLQIWFGPKGSENYFLGHFSKDRNSFEGAWKWPSGGYDVKARRVH